MTTPDESMHVLLERLAGEMREGFAKIKGSVDTAMAKHETELVQFKKDLADSVAKHETDHAKHDDDIKDLQDQINRIAERSSQSVTWRAFWIGLGGVIASLGAGLPILDKIINK